LNNSIRDSFDVESFADLLPLRDGDGKAIGLFSDHGSWLGVIWGTDCLLEIRDLRDGSVGALNFASGLRRSRSMPDLQSATLNDATDLRICFAEDGALVVEVRAEVSLSFDCTLPHQLHPLENGIWWLLISKDAMQLPPRNLFQQNRARWNQYFKTAFAQMQQPDDPTQRRLLARAITTMLWNLRAPQKHMPHYGVIPSPFSYCGYWAWDSWKHAHALASFAPELAAEQLRAQFCRQRGDGMVPDTVMPNPADDNWQNTKPPLAAWALHKIWQATSDNDLAVELYPKCAAQLQWWKNARRVNGEILYRAGGVDHETATWDTGWDLSARFENVPLQPFGDWKLFDLWQPDINVYILNELRAMAAIAATVGADVNPWLQEAKQLTAAIQNTLWDDSKNCFCDVRASSGESVGIRSAASWLPLWADAATADQHQRGMQTMKSTTHFNTAMPFPTLAASEPAFNPDGYWNGGVWIDHAAYAYTLLPTDHELRKRLLTHLSAQNSLYECYSPLTGAPADGSRPAVAQFSWTAAACIEILLGSPRR